MMAMGTMDDNSQDNFELTEGFSNRLRWFLFLRIIIGTFLLVFALLIQFKGEKTYLYPPLIYLYLSIAVIYLFSFIYLFCLQWINNLKVLTYLILFFDHLLVTFIVFVTGGILSVFSFFYPLLIITASILLFRKGGFLSAAASSVLYGGLLYLEFTGKIHPMHSISPGTPFFPKGSYILYSILVNTSAYFLVASLSSYLSEGTKETKKELKEKQINIDELKSLNEDIIQSMTSGLITLDLEEKIISLNRAAEKILGTSYQDIHHKNILEILPSMKKYLEDSDDQLPADSSSYRNEIDFKRKDGEKIYLGFSISSLKNSQSTKIGKLLIFQDISRFIEMGKQLKQVERTAAIGELGAKMAHEIRNPLASMCGSIQILKEEVDIKDTMSQRLMEIVLREAGRLDLLITNFLLFARPSLSEEKVVNLSHIIDDTLKIFAQNVENDIIKITEKIPGDIWLKIDSDKIKQVFWNIFLNAGQAMPLGGELNVEIRNDGFTHKTTVEHPIEIKISDTGSGISPENRKKIFDPFFTTKKQGTGLGLSIVKRIIEDHLGKIRIDSTEGNGTAFFIYLPSVPSPSGKDPTRAVRY